jgi:hypothetical protein
MIARPDPTGADPTGDPTGYISRVRFWELVIARAGYADRSVYEGY